MGKQNQESAHPRIEPPVFAGSLGRTIKRARKARGLGLRELAKATGVTHSYLLKLEAASITTPSVDNLELLAAQLGFNPDELIFHAGQLPRDFAQLAQKHPVVVARLIHEFTQRVARWAAQGRNPEEGYREDPAWAQLSFA